MTVTLTDLIQRSLVKMGNTVSYRTIATGGSATTFIDTTLGSIYANSDLANGTCIVAVSTDGQSPQGKWGKISAYVPSTSVGTIVSVTDAIQTGDIIVLVTPRYPIATIIGLANSILQGLGTIALVDTSLTTISGATEYSLPVACKKQSLIKIEVQTRTDNSADNRWVELMGWHYVPSAAGSVGKIIFDSPLDAGFTLKIWYVDTHPEVALYSDVIHETIPIELAACKLAVEMFNWGGVQEEQNYSYQKCLQDLQSAERIFKVWKPQKKDKFFMWSD